MKNTRKTLLSIIAVAAVCFMLGTAVGGCFTPAAVAENTVVTTVLTSPFTEAIEQVKPSVVGISNYQIVRYSNNGYGNGYGFSPFDFYGFGGFGGFGGYGGSGDNRSSGYEEQEVLHSTGSGVVIAEGGYVLTNYHVVDGATKLQVTVGEEKYDAYLQVYDENADIAIVQAPELKLAPVALGNSDNLRVGDWAICIGNPLSEKFNGTVTAGIISGIDRAISSTNVDKYGRKATTTNSMIQTDAAINSGNSGGGMFAVTGELMGIPTMKYSGTVYSGASIDGIGLCIPINAAKPLIEQVLSGNYTPVSTPDPNASASSSNGLNGKPRMGVTVQSAAGAFPALANNGTIPAGAYIAEVEAGSPAEAAGLKAGDIIVEANSTIITTPSQLTSIIGEMNTGDSIDLTYYRTTGLVDWDGKSEIPDGDYAETTVTLAVIDLVQQ